MKQSMVNITKKLIITAAAACAAAGVFATNISGDPELYNITKVDDAYQAAPVYNATADHNLSEAGWYAGLKLTWDSRKQVGTSTQASVSDNLGGTVVSSFTVIGLSNLSYVDKSPAGSGLGNQFEAVRSGLTVTRYLTTTTWYFSVTPDMMKTCAAQEKDYEVTLTIGDNTYTVVVPRTVTLVDDNGVQLYPLTEQLDITGETLEFLPEASFTYDGTEKTVTPTLTVNGLTATFDVDAENSKLTATEIGTYTVTVNGTGDFKGTATGTWEIKNTTGAIDDVAATTSETAGTYEDGTLIVTDTTALAYADGAWTAGLTLTWPMESNSPALGNGYGHYVKPETMQMTIGETVYTGREIVDSEAVYAEGKLEAEVKNGSYTYYQGISRRTQNFSYLSSTVWTVAITPAAVEAALAEEKTALEHTMRAGAIIWGNSTEGDPDGVAFADYKIELSLENPVVFVLGENETHDLGDTVLTTTRIKLAPGASVTSSVAQATDAIFTEATGYEVERSESGGVYTYTTKFTHQHNWSFNVVDGTNLVATCGNDECDLNGEVRMWLDVATTEKDYDGVAVVPQPRFGDGFDGKQFPNMSMTLTVTDVEGGQILDVGEYGVLLSVTGLGDNKTHELSTTVTINRKDITGATLVLTPASTTYNAAEQTVEPSVTVGNLAATIEVDTETSITAATEIGRYSVTVNGTGNFMGTLTGTWDIVNTTGSMKSVAAANAGVGTVENNRLTVTDTAAFGYSEGVWSVGLVLTWPMEKQTVLGIATGADYVTEDMVRISKEYGEIAHEQKQDSYIANWSNTPFTYLDTTTWTIELTPAIIDAALAEEKTDLEYTMRAGAVQSDTYAQGVAFTDYKIVIPLEGIKLYDENGRQVYPEQSEQDIVEEMKDAIDAVEGLDAEEKDAAKAKVDTLVELSEDAEEVRDWIEEKTDGDYGVLADSDYIVASYALDTEDLITDASEVEVVGFESTDSGFSFAVKIDDGDIESARVKAAGVIQRATSLEDDAFEPIDAERVVVVENKMTITKDADFECEFFKIVIKKDSAE